MDNNRGLLRRNAGGGYRVCSFTRESAEMALAERSRK